MHPIIVLGLVREVARDWWCGIPYPGRRRRHERAMERGVALAHEMAESQRRRDGQHRERKERGEREW